MKSYLAIIIVLIGLIAMCKADIASFSYTVVPNNNTDMKRITAIGSFSIPIIASGVSYSSLSGQKTTNGGELNAIHGSAYQFLGTSPTSTFGYWNGGIQFNKNSANGTTFSTEGSAGFTGTVYKAIQEINENGQIVRDIRLRSFGYKISNASGSGVVKYAVFNGDKFNPELDVEFTFIVTDEIVNLSVNGKQAKEVTPKSLETIVAIDATNYKYSSPQSKLRLISYVLSGQFKRTTSGSGNNKLDVITSGVVSNSFATSAVVDSSLQGVSVSVTRETDLTVIDNSQVVAQWERKFSSKRSLNRVIVDFPVNAKIIVYDPTTSVPSSSSSLCVSISLIIACLSFFLF